MQQSAADHCRHLPPPFFTEYFPNGLKLLLVDPDEDTLTSIQTYLTQPYYDIIMCRSADLALGHLQHLQKEGQSSYDLVCSDVGSEDKDGYQFIREVQSLGSNIGHVAICESERSSNEIVRAYKSGACSVLWKPVSELGDETMNLWRHVCRMKEQRKASETHLSNNNNVTPETHLCDVEHMRREQHETSETYLNNSDDVYHGDYIQQNRSVPLVLQNQDQGSSSVLAIEDQFFNHGRESAPKKRRVAWTGLLQKWFVDAVDQLGGHEKAVPKRILEMMNQIKGAPHLTRENVGSHLQKHRQKKLKEKEQHASISLFEPNHQTQIQPSEQNFNNFGHVAPLSTVPSSLMGNGGNNLTSFMQELYLTSGSSCQIPVSGTYVTTTGANQQIGNSFGSSMLQRTQIGTSFESILQPHQNQNSSMHQLQRYVTTRGANNDGIQAMGTSFASNTGMQQFGQNPSSGSSSHVSTNYNGIINQNQALGTSDGTNMQELSNMLPKPQIAPNPTSCVQQLDQNPSSGSGIINQNQAQSSSFRRSNMQQQPITQNLTSDTQQPNQHLPEATHVSGDDGDEFLAYLNDYLFDPVE